MVADLLYSYKFYFLLFVSLQVTAILGKDFPFTIEAHKVDRKYCLTSCLSVQLQHQRVLVSYVTRI